MPVELVGVSLRLGRLGLRRFELAGQFGDDVVVQVVIVLRSPGVHDLKLHLSLLERRLRGAGGELPLLELIEEL